MCQPYIGTCQAFHFNLIDKKHVQGGLQLNWTLYKIPNPICRNECYTLCAMMLHFSVQANVAPVGVVVILKTHFPNAYYGLS